MSAIDGGHEAISGFTVQSMAVLLYALKRDDWTKFQVEPACDEGTFQKVDLRWVLQDGRREVAQVKSSKNSITVPDAKRWAKELRRSATADIYRLWLFAPTTGGVSDLDEVEGVRIEVSQGDTCTVWESLAWRLFAWLENQGEVRSAKSIHETARLLVGRTIVGALERTVWTPERLRQLSLSLSRAIDEASETPVYRPGGFEVEVLWIVAGNEYEGCTELLRYTFRNTGQEALTLPSWTCTWTDADNLTVTRVSDGLAGNPEYHEVVDETTGALEVEIRLRTETVPPGGYLTLSVEASRAHAFQRHEGMWVFSDRLLSTDAPQKADVYVAFPCEGKISAPGVLRHDSSIAHWKLLTGAEGRILSAVLTDVSASKPCRSSLAENMKEHWSNCPI